jgi:aryl-alcohol dehydrogenase-like predicted oxidoreductase
VIARAPLRRSLLSGKWKPEDQSQFKGEDVRARNFAGEAFKKELDKIEQLRFLASDTRTLAQAALAFCLADPAVSVVIAGARDAAQMRANAEASELRLAPEELARIERLWRSGFKV